MNWRLLFCLVLFFSTSVLHAQSGKRVSRKAKKQNELRQRKAIVQTAKLYLGSKYVYGGSSTKGFDCSGLCQYVYKQHGIALPRNSKAQKKALLSRRAVRKLKPGDLVFFGRLRVNHVGIVVGSGKDRLVMIHAASGGVEQIDVRESTYWNKRLKFGGPVL